MNWYVPKTNSRPKRWKCRPPKKRLNANAGVIIGYMNAMANLKIAEGVANGKVQTIVVPYDFKGIVNAK